MIVSSLYSGMHLTGPKPRCFTTSGSTQTSAAGVEAAVRAVARRGPGARPDSRPPAARVSPLAARPRPARRQARPRPARSPLAVPVSAAIYLFLMVTLELIRISYPGRLDVTTGALPAAVAGSGSSCPGGRAGRPIVASVSPVTASTIAARIGGLQRLV